MKPSFAIVQASLPVTSAKVAVKDDGKTGQKTEIPLYVENHEIVGDPEFIRRGPLEDAEARLGRAPASLPATAPGVVSNSPTGERIKRVFQLPRETRPQLQRSRILQEWEGTVTDISSGSFTGRMKNLTHRDGPEELISFSFDEANDDDRDLIKLGAVFYLSVGYLTEPYGTRRTSSTLYFQRLPAWTTSEIGLAREKSTRYSSLFEDDMAD